MAFGSAWQDHMDGNCKRGNGRKNMRIGKERMDTRYCYFMRNKCRFPFSPTSIRSGPALCCRPIRLLFRSDKLEGVVTTVQY